MTALEKETAVTGHFAEVSHASHAANLHENTVHPDIINMGVMAILGTHSNSRSSFIGESSNQSLPMLDVGAGVALA
jgi:hypothetical protein